MNAYTDYSGRGVNLPSAAVMTYCAPQYVGRCRCTKMTQVID